MRYLAIDYGTVRIGLAVCDPGHKVVSPFGVIRRDRGLFERLAQILEQHQIGAVVVGLPLNMDGSEGPQAKMVRAFVARLKTRVTVPIFLQDERLSSFAAGQRLEQWTMSRAKKGRRLDAVAAAEILEAFLEGQST